MTDNLASAIRQLRYPDYRRPVWADVICIDQKNTLQRTQQVSMMGDIYRLANPVFAFLGPEELYSTYIL